MLEQHILFVSGSVVQVKKKNPINRVESDMFVSRKYLAQGNRAMSEASQSTSVCQIAAM